MDAQLRQQVDAVIDAYNLEFLHWNKVPTPALESRHRLGVFIQHNLEWIIRSEIKILWRKIAQMRQARSSATLH